MTSLTRLRKVTASRPSTSRWSYVSARYIMGRGTMAPPMTTGRWLMECMPMMADCGRQRSAGRVVTRPGATGPILGRLAARWQGHLGRVDDGRRQHGPEHAAVGDREGAPCHLIDGKRPVPRLDPQRTHRLLDLGKLHVVHAADHRDDESLRAAERGARNEAGPGWRCDGVLASRMAASCLPSPKAFHMYVTPTLGVATATDTSL